MKAIILVAGYATRLYPLTLNRPKALLEINKRPIIDYIVDKINEVEEVTDIYVISNHKFAKNFEDWAKTVKSAKPVTVIDDLTTDEDNRRGAIGDIQYTIEQENIDDEIMVIAGDNFFGYSLKDCCDYYRSVGGDVVCVKPLDDYEELKRYGIAVLDENGRVIDIEEKPMEPKSNNVVYATYIYGRDTVPMVKEYLEEGNKPDAPGNFVVWLHKRKAVYAFRFTEDCYDIGTPESYKEVCDIFGK